MGQGQDGWDPFLPPTLRTIQNRKKGPAKAEEMQVGWRKHAIHGVVYSRGGVNAVFVWLCEIESWHGGEGVACSGQTGGRAQVPEPCPQATGPFPFSRRPLCWAKVRVGIS